MVLSKVLTSFFNLKEYIKYLSNRYYESDVTAEQIAIINSVKKGDVIIDAGGNVGKFTFPMALKGATVHVFEPNPYAYKVLHGRFKSWDNINLYNAALSTEDGSIKLFLHENSDENPVAFSTGSSTVEAKINVDKENYEEVEAVDIVKFTAKLDSPIKILKMDIEGAEVSLMNYLMDHGSIENIQHVLLETHEKKIPSLYDATLEMKKRIKELNFGDKVLFDWH